MTLVVLGIDALDAAQVEYFDIDTFRLATHGEMETFAHQNPIPHTGEVWPSVATGLHPSEHGITHGGESKWDNIVVEYASRIAGPYLSMGTRADLGRLIRRFTGADWEINETSEGTFFDGEGRHVHNWPGTINGNEVRTVWRHINHTVDEGSPQEDFDRELSANEAQKFAWVEEMLNYESVIVGTHIHLLDASGHAYARNEDHYRQFYEKAAAYVERIRAAMAEDDDLLILSDHGINTEWLENDTEHIESMPDAGHHSFRAFSSSTLDTRPTSVFDVPEWVEQNIGPHQEAYDRQKEETELEMPEETLRDLGYIE